MKKNNFRFLFLTALTGAGLAVVTASGFANGKLVTGGIIAIEKDVTYLTPLGLQDGAKKDDVVQILRGERKVAEVRLISVLGTSSVAEVVKLFNSDGIMESDSVMLSSSSSETTDSKIQNTESALPAVTSKEAVLFSGNDTDASAVAESAERKRLEQLQVDHQAEILQKDKQAQQRLKGLSSEMDALQAKVMEKDSTIDTLKIQAENLKKDLSARDQRLGDLKLEMDDLNRKFEAAQQQIREQQVAHETRVMSLQEDQSQQIVKKDNAAQEKLIAQESEFKNQIAVLKGQIDGLTEDKTKIVDQLNSKESMVKALMEERARLRGEVDGLNTRITQLIEEHTADFLKQDQDHQKKFRLMSEDMQVKISTAEAEIASLKKNYQAESDQMKNDLAEKQAKIADFQKQQDSLQVDLMVREQKLEDAATEVSQLHDALKNAQDKAAAAEAALSNTQAEVNIQITALKNALSEKQTSIESLTKDKETLSGGVTSRDQQLKDLTGQADQLREELKTAHNTLELLQSDMSALKATSQKQILDLQGELVKKQLILVAVGKEKELAAAEVKDRDKRLSALNDQLQQLRNQLKSTHDSADAQASSLKSEIMQRLAIIDGLNKDKEALAGDIKDRDQKLSDLKARAEELATALQNTEDQLMSTRNELGSVNTSAQIQAATLQNDLDQTRAVLDGLKKDKESLLVEVSDRDQKISDVTTRADQLTEALQKNNDQLSSTQEELSALKVSSQKQAVEFQAELDQTRAMLDAVTKDKESLIVELKDKDQKLADLKLEVEQLRDDLQKVRDDADTQVGSLQDELGKRQTMVEALAQDKDALLAQLKINEKSLADLKLEVQQVYGALKQSKDGFSALDKELNALKISSQAQATALQAELDKKNGLLAALNKEKDVLSGGLKDKDQKLFGLSADAEKLRVSLKASQDQVAVLDKDLNALKASSQIQISALQGELDKKKILLEGWEQQKETLSDGLKDKNQQLESARTDIEKLNAELRKSQENAAKDASAVKTVLKDKKDADEQIKSLSKEKQSLLKSLQDKDAKLTEVSAKLQQLTDDAKRARGSVDGQVLSLKNELEQKDVVLESLNKGKALFMGEIKEKDQKLADLSLEMQKLRVDFDKTREKSASLESELNALKASSQSTIASLKSELDKKQVMLDVTGKDKVSFMDDVKDRDKKITDLSSSLQDVRMELKKAQDQSLALSKELNDVKLTAQNEKAVLKSELDKKEVLLDVLSKDKSSFMSELKERDQKLTELNANAEQLRAELRKTQDKSSSLEKDLNDLKLTMQNEKTALKSELDKKEVLLDVLSKDKSSFMSELKERDQKLTDLNVSAEQLRSELKKSQDKSASLESELSAMKIKSPGEVNALKMELDRKDNALRTLSQDKDALSDQLKKNQARLESLQDELAQLKAENPQKDKQIAVTQESLKREISEKESRIKTLTEENTWLKQNVDKLNQLLIHINKDSYSSKKESEPQRQTVVQQEASSAPARTSSSSTYQASLENWQSYYVGIRKMILSRLGEADLSAYLGKAGTVEVEFEVLANGSLKNGLQFRGTDDPALQKILEQCFHKASPFPKFPATLAEESKIFTIVIEF